MKVLRNRITQFQNNITVNHLKLFRSIFLKKLYALCLLFWVKRKKILETLFCQSSKTAVVSQLLDKRREFLEENIQN